MGIDLNQRHRRTKPGRKAAVTDNKEVLTLVRLFKFLGRRAESPFAEQIVKRLSTSRRNRPPMSLTKVIKYWNNRTEKIPVIVGTVTDDVRLHEVPKVTIAALRFTESARARILKAGGQCLTLDQLAQRHPTGANTVLLKGPVKAREAEKYFGKAPGVPDSHTKPHVRSKGRKFEKARGRRNSRGFKV